MEPNQSEWRVKIATGGPAEDRLHIFRRVNGGVEVIVKIEEGTLTTKFVPAGGSLSEQCTLSASTENMRGIVEAFVRYAQSQGFKSSEESRDSGKLEATTRHLEDMRSLVFKKK